MLSRKLTKNCIKLDLEGDSSPHQIVGGRRHWKQHSTHQSFFEQQVFDHVSTKCDFPLLPKDIVIIRNG